MQFPQMPDHKLEPPILPPAPPAPPPLPPFFQRRPGLARLLELALAVGLAYLGARFGIPIPPPQLTQEQPAEKLPMPTVGIDGGPRIVGASEYGPHKLVRLKAENVKAGAAVLWRVSPRADVHRASTRADVLEFAAPPGAYDVELLVLSSDPMGLSVEEVFTRVTVGQRLPDPKSEPKGDGKLDPSAAIARVRFGSGGCSATVIGPRRADGRWDVLTASHCMDGVGSRGTMTMKDGRSFTIRVAVHQKRPDLAWCVTEDVVADMPYANLAPADPAEGAGVWHMGYGIDKPGNREDGEVRATPNADGQLRFSLSVSPGDSGGGIFRADTNELISCACCTAAFAVKTHTWGASTGAIRKARPAGSGQ